MTPWYLMNLKYRFGIELEQRSGQNNNHFGDEA